MSKRIYTDFDLPKTHLSGREHFVPPKARQADEVERRRALRPGTLLAEYQYRGLAMANIILGNLRDKPDFAFAAPLLQAAGLNTAWYTFARDSEVMRRRLKLPRLASPDPEQRPSSYMLRRQAGDVLNEAVDNAFRLSTATRNGLHTVGAYQRQLARNTGHASLTLACVDIGDRVGYGEIEMTDFELQDLARRRGMRALHDARALESVVGTPPSMAALADPDSDLSVFWRRNGPNGAVEAYEQAIAEMMPTA